MVTTYPTLHVKPGKTTYVPVVVVRPLIPLASVFLSEIFHHGKEYAAMCVGACNAYSVQSRCKTLFGTRGRVQGQSLPASRRDG